MSRLIESIRLLDGRFYNLSYHALRMRGALGTLYGDTREPDLEKFLREGEYPRKGLYKCRIVYDNQSRETTFIPYEPRKITTVRVVEDNDINYPFKYADRESINRLFARRGDCDDVLIIRNGMVTDCSFSNVVFRKGREWFTPSSPLLKGTMRQSLLEKNKIHPREIRKDDIRSFETFRIINAMLEFDSPEIEVSKIVF